MADPTRPAILPGELTPALPHTCSIETCTDPAAITRLPATKLPHTVLIGTSVSAGQAVQHARQLNRALPELPVLALLHASEPSIILILLREGVTGCLIEPVSRAELRACITQAIQGATTVLCRRARALLLENCFQQDLGRTNPHVTRRERELLQWLSSNLTHKQIAAKLGIAEETVHRHASNLYKKYHAHSRDDAIKKHFRVTSCV